MREKKGSLVVFLLLMEGLFREKHYIQGGLD